MLPGDPKAWKVSSSDPKTVKVFQAGEVGKWMPVPTFAGMKPGVATVTATNGSSVYKFTVTVE